MTSDDEPERDGVDDCCHWCGKRIPEDETPIADMHRACFREAKAEWRSERDLDAKGE
jgi:hypothetical protein